MTKVLTINAGSSTLKWKLYEMPAQQLVGKGAIDRIAMPDSVVSVTTASGKSYQKTVDQLNYQQGAQVVVEKMKQYQMITQLDEITVVGHRVVFGGEIFKHSVVVDAQVLKQIKNLSELAPLHNPVEAQCIEQFKKIIPNAVEVAVFDTSLYLDMPEVAYIYSLPYQFYKKYGARKYGAHGTSHRYVSRRAAEILKVPLKDQRMITLHLGSGCSMTAFDHGKVVDTSMGFTPQAGLTMSTRAGDVDASLVAYLMDKTGIKNVDQFNEILNEKSGLLGLSGISPDLRKILEARKKNQRAQLAIDVFINRIIRYIGSYVVEMGGLDTLVFTAGVGENSVPIRQLICDKLTNFGVKLDPQKNKVVGQEAIINRPDSAVHIMVVPTNEELMIAKDAYRLSA
ncbi:acetate/propionate family kinase [Pediococcus siamensis]|uniref:acetate/propionate family kinase n=1 Tax=Pediococcus siamensis TaxID=381829 RepID=UPI00399FC534